MVISRVNDFLKNETCGVGPRAWRALVNTCRARRGAGGRVRSRNSGDTESDLCEEIQSEREGVRGLTTSRARGGWRAVSREASAGPRGPDTRLSGPGRSVSGRPGGGRGAHSVGGSAPEVRPDAASQPSAPAGLGLGALSRPLPGSCRPGDPRCPWLAATSLPPLPLGHMASALRVCPDSPLRIASDLASAWFRAAHRHGRRFCADVTLGHGPSHPVLSKCPTPVAVTTAVAVVVVGEGGMEKNTRWLTSYRGSARPWFLSGSVRGFEGRGGGGGSVWFFFRETRRSLRLLRARRSPTRSPSG